MDVIAGLESVDFLDIYGPTTEAFLQLLEKNRKVIESTKRATYQYGSTARHKLDVYYPERSEKLPPILLFSYGGGLEVGDRILPESNGLVYANLGAFFAQRGFLTAIADYRLVSSGAVYPDCSKDLSDALEWIIANLTNAGDTSHIFFLGHSAGAFNQSLLLFHPTLLRDDVRKRIKGCIFNGGAFQFEGKDVLVRIQAYYGYDGLHITNSPRGLLRAASDSFVAQLPPIMTIIAEKDPPVIFGIFRDFGALLRERCVRSTEYTNKGHNHISSNLALCSGEGEEWGEEVVHWMRSQTQ